MSDYSVELSGAGQVRSLTAACRQDLEREAHWALQTIASLIPKGPSDGQLVGFGWVDLVIHVEGAKARLFAAGHGDIAESPDVSLALSTQTRILDLCRQLSLRPQFARHNQWIATSGDWRAAKRVRMARVRHRDETHSGWLVTPDGTTPDTVEELSVLSLVTERSALGAALGMPPGSVVTFEDSAVESVGLPS